MGVLETDIADIKLLEPVRHVESRGFFSEVVKENVLLRVTAGSIFDVAVEIRWGSPSFGGFAHGYCTLEPDTEVIYKVSAYYSPDHDRGLLWSDPALGIAWPVSADAALVSDLDRTHPVLSRLPRYFCYEPPSNRRGCGR